MPKAILGFMSLELLKKKLKENDISGVYLLCGPEEYTKDHYTKLIRKKVDTSPLPEFNHIYFNASSDNISDLEDAVFSLPYMWDNKLIEITDIESARITENDANEYARIFSDIPDYLTILVVLRADEKTEEARVAKTAKSGIGAFVNAVRENGLVVEFESEKADKLTTWISKHFNAKGVQFDPAVPREIINVCGTDMYILQGEINKLTEVFDGTPLTVKDVKRYCCGNSSYKYFDIAAALNRRDIISAKRILESLNLNREKIPLAVGFLSKNYSEMLLVRAALDSGVGLDAVAKSMKIQPWRVGKIVQAIGQIDIKTISFAVNELYNADMKIKSYRGDPKKILEMTFYRICTYGRKA